MADGVRFTFDQRALEGALKAVGELVTFDGAPLMEAVASLGESQTRRRITDEKTAPDGTPWPPNAAGTSILFATGQHLLASVAFTSSADEAVWGASWEFAHVHQDGAVIEPKTAAALRFKLGDRTVHAKRVTIPARPFVGLSAENRAEITELVTDYFAALAPGRAP